MVNIITIKNDRVPYLDPKNIAAFENATLISTEGLPIKINSLLLGAMSHSLEIAFFEVDDDEYTITTEFGLEELIQIKQFCITGTCNAMSQSLLQAFGLKIMPVQILVNNSSEALKEQINGILRNNETVVSKKKSKLNNTTSVSKNITRKDIVEYIHECQQNKKKGNKITPATPSLYKKSYIDYLCSKLKIDPSEVSPSIYNDIKIIKQYYTQSHRNIPIMIRKHTKFFETIIKPNRELGSPDNWHVKKHNVIVDKNSCGKLMEFDPQLQPLEKISTSDKELHRKQAQGEKQYHCCTKCKISFRTTEGLKCHIIGIHDDGDYAIEQNPNEHDPEYRKIIKNADITMKPSLQHMEVILNSFKEIEKAPTDVERKQDFLDQTRKSRKQVCTNL